MDHPQHVALIRSGVDRAGPRWLELGAGDGEFTLALADVLGGGTVTAVDLDAGKLDRLRVRLRERFPGATVAVRVGDFTRELPGGDFDGILAANSLHFVREPLPVLQRLHRILVPGGRLVIVEYDADRGNRWVPHPIPFRRWADLAGEAGFEPPVLLHRVPSRFLGSIYGAATRRRA